MQKNGDRPLLPEEQEFFRRLYQTHYPALYACACQLGIGREAAEDYVQDAFTVTIRHIEDIRNSGNPGIYLKRALKNVIGYRLRSLRYAVSLQKKLAEELDLSQNGHYTDDLRPETLYQGAITEAEMTLLLRFYLDGWSQKELAEEMGISENACRLRIRRAKRHLRSVLEETGPPGAEDPINPAVGSEERREEQP